jgi:hypothetical protein
MNAELNNSIYFKEYKPEMVLQTSKHIESKLTTKASYLTQYGNNPPTKLDSSLYQSKPNNEISIKRNFYSLNENLPTNQKNNFNITPLKLRKRYTYNKPSEPAHAESFKFIITSSDKKANLMSTYSSKRKSQVKKNENCFHSIAINLNKTFQDNQELDTYFITSLNKSIEKVPIPNSSFVNTSHTDKEINNLNSQIFKNFKSKAKIDIPLDKIDDEKYKIKEIKKLRLPYFKDNKTLCKKDLVKTKKLDLLENSIYFQNQRRKLAHSVKRVYTSEIPFYNSINNEAVYFKVFNDIDIGFNKNWQELIHELDNDQDIPSDNELINDAKKHLLNELKNAIVLLKEKKYN